MLAAGASAGAHEVVLGPGLYVLDVALEVCPELRVGDRDLSDLLALREDGQTLALMVEVPCLTCQRKKSLMIDRFLL